MIKTSDIRIRDPFVVPVETEGLYYLYGTTDDISVPGATGFDCFRGGDLENWLGPLPAFRPQPGFWADQSYWAPEVHCYQGRFYMFATFKADGVCRGTQVLVSEKPEGPFVPHSDGPVTSRDWECLDGTLFVDETDQPWIVFCHEWVQVGDGEIWAQRLREDLSSAVGEATLLFKATEAPWVEAFPGPSDFVTDGPFLYSSNTGQLLMIWSSFRENRYTIGCVRSESGNVTGPWLHDHAPIYQADGGHAMLFTTFDGQLMIAFHSPNEPSQEHPVFLPARDLGGSIRVNGQGADVEN